MKNEVTLTFTVDELNVILGALGMRPFLEVVTLIDKIRKEASEQLKESSTVQTISLDASTLAKN